MSPLHGLMKEAYWSKDEKKFFEAVTRIRVQSSVRETEGVKRWASECDVI